MTALPLSVEGFALDRRWMLIDASGRFVSQRECPALALIRPSCTADGLHLHITAPGMSPLTLSCASPEGPSLAVSVWIDHFPARDVGDATAQWFSEFLGRAVRLVDFDPAVQRLASKKWTGDDDAPTRFADGFPFLVTNTASLDDLNRRMNAKGAPSIPMDRFRTNFVIDGLEAYEEDHIDVLTLWDDAKDACQPDGVPVATLRFVKPCARCPIPTIDQTNGTTDTLWPHEPLDTLATYRADPRVGGGLTFGINAILIDGIGATLRPGMHVDYEIDFGD